MRISVIIPAYNEEKNIKQTLGQISRFLLRTVDAYEIIVVDDGSSDKTVSAVQNAQRDIPGIKLLCLSKNYGKGYAVKTGVHHTNGDTILFLDADGSTSIEELPNFLNAHAHGSDIVIGSRYLSNSAINIKQPWYRIALGRIGNALIQTTLLPGIKDTQCGFKTFRSDAAKKIFSLQTIDRWGFDMEVLSIGRLLGYSIKEVPVSWSDTTNRVSRFRPLKDAHRTLKDLLKIKYNLLTKKYVKR